MGGKSLPIKGLAGGFVDSRLRPDSRRQKRARRGRRRKISSQKLLEARRGRNRHPRGWFAWEKLNRTRFDPVTGEPLPPRPGGRPRADAPQYGVTAAELVALGKHPNVVSVFETIRPGYGASLAEQNASETPAPYPSRPRPGRPRKRRRRKPTTPTTPTTLTPEAAADRLRAQQRRALDRKRRALAQRVRDAKRRSAALRVAEGPADRVRWTDLLARRGGRPEGALCGLEAGRGGDGALGVEDGVDGPGGEKKRNHLTIPPIKENQDITFWQRIRGDV